MAMAPWARRRQRLFLNRLLRLRHALLPKLALLLLLPVPLAQ